MDRELARVKVTANRVAVVVANEWKDDNDKVMPVKQWLEERRFMQVNSSISLLFLLSIVKQYFML
jgi:Microtubule-associated protein 70